MRIASDHHHSRSKTPLKQRVTAGLYIRTAEEARLVARPMRKFPALNLGEVLERQHLPTVRHKPNFLVRPKLAFRSWRAVRL